MAKHKKLRPLVYHALTSFPFIERDFDALTLYELISKIVEKLNECVEIVDDIEGTLEDTVRDIINEWVADGTIAEIILDLYYVTPASFGAKADGTTDDYTAFSDMVTYAVENGKKIYIPDKSFYLSSPIFVSDEMVVSDKGTYTKQHVVASNSKINKINAKTKVVSGYFPEMLQEGDDYYWIQGCSALSDGTPYALCRTADNQRGLVVKFTKDYSQILDSYEAMIYHANSCCIINDNIMLIAPLNDTSNLLALNLATKTISNIPLEGLVNVHGVTYDDDHNLIWVTCVTNNRTDYTGNVICYKFNDIGSVVSGAETMVPVHSFNTDDGTGAINVAIKGYPEADARLYQNIVYMDGNIYCMWSISSKRGWNVGAMILQYDYDGKIVKTYYLDLPMQRGEVESIFITNKNLQEFNVVYNRWYAQDEGESYFFAVQTGFLNGNIPDNNDYTYSFIRENMPIYVDESAETCGDGSYNFPINDLETAIQRCKIGGNYTIFLRHDTVLTKPIIIHHYQGYLKFDSPDNARCKISRKITVSGCCSVDFMHIDFESEDDYCVEYFYNSKGGVSWSSVTGGKGIKSTGASVVAVDNVRFTDCDSCVTASRGGMITTYGATGSGNTLFASQEGGTIITQPRATLANIATTVVDSTGMTSGLTSLGVNVLEVI